MPDGPPVGTSDAWILGNLALIAPDRPLVDTGRAPVPDPRAILIGDRGHAGTLANRLEFPGRETPPAPWPLPRTKRQDRYEWLVARRPDG